VYDVLNTIGTILGCTLGVFVFGILIGILSMQATYNTKDDEWLGWCTCLAALNLLLLVLVGIVQHFFA
jgi:hypothetical protein